MNHHDPVFVTAQGLEKLLSERDYLLTIKRVEIAENLHEAQSGGDSLDNTELQVIQYEQLLVELRISELQRLISAAHLIELGNGDGIALMGSTVTIQGDERDHETYTIVGSTEANPSQGRISGECPLGRALLRKRAGELVEVKTPEGLLKYRIVSIS